MKKAAALLLVFTLLFSAAPFTAYAAENRYEEAEIAGDIIGIVMDMIMEDYVSDEDVTLEALYDAALRGISAELDDYSGYLTAGELASFYEDVSGELTGLGAMLRLNNGGLPEIARTYKNSPAQKAGVLRGDVVLYVNGQTTKGKALDEVTDIILDPEHEDVKLQIRRDGERINFNITKEQIESLTVYTETLENLLGVTGYENIGYINLSSFSKNSAEDLEAAMADIKGQGAEKLILDMRGNGGGILQSAEAICGLLVPEGVIYTAVDNKGEEFTARSALKEVPFEDVAVLVDDYTASAAELTAAAMQDTGAVVIGITTYGKGVVQSIFSLPTGGGFKLTVEEYFRRSGEKVNGVGVTPDIEVWTDYYDYETPEDEMLRKAAEVLT